MTQKNLKKLHIREHTIFDGIFAKYFLKSIFYIWFKLAGWKLTRSNPEGAGVTISAPHTSNWDFIYALGAAILQDVKIYFSIKDSWCRKPIIGRWIMYLGAMPIDRNSKGVGQVNLIKQFINTQKSTRIFFLFTPEGTRSNVAKWKTGFYYVAQGCGIPVFLAKIDYRLKEVGVFHSFEITGDKENDIQAIQASYESICGKYSDKQFPKYTGPIPSISEREAVIIKSLYLLKGVATRVDINAKAKLGELTTTMFDFLIEKGMLEQTQTVGNTSSDNEPTYRLTFAGKGCLLHLYPSLLAH